MSLSKLYIESRPPLESPLWATKNFEIVLTPDNFGYHVINSNTGAVEMFLEQEGSAVLAIISLEEAYAEIMQDPEREWKVRTAKAQAHQQMRLPLSGGGKRPN